MITTNWFSFKISPNQFKRDSDVADQLERWIADSWEIERDRPKVEVLDGKVEVHEKFRTYTYVLPKKFLKIKKVLKSFYLTIYER